MRVLLAAGADPNVKDASGSTALHEAVFCEATDRVELLLAARADLAACNGRGKTPLEVGAPVPPLPPRSSVTLTPDQPGPKSNLLLLPFS